MKHKTLVYMEETMTKNKKIIFVFIVLIFTLLILFIAKTRRENKIEYPEFETNGQSIYLPTYIPDGYSVKSVRVSDGMTTAEFTDGSEVICFVEIRSTDVSIDIDDEDYETKKAELGSKYGFLSEWDDRKIFTYTDEISTVSISGKLKNEEIEKIVKSIKLYS